MALERINDMVANSKFASALAAAAILVTPATAGAKHEQQERPLAIGLGTINEEGDYLDQTLTFNAYTGRTVCKLIQHDDDMIYGSTTLLTRVETKNADGEWQPDDRFKQPFSSTEPDSAGDPHTAEGKLVTHYRQKGIWKLAGKRATRIACYGSGNTLGLELPSKKPTHKKPQRTSS